MKWKGSTQIPENNSRILFEQDGDLEVDVYNNDVYPFFKVDKWMYESEAKQILFEHSWPNLKYKEDL